MWRNSKEKLKASYIQHIRQKKTQNLINIYSCVQNHVLVLNGESGSGKTETAKHAIDYLAFISSKNEALKTRLNQVRWSILRNKQIGLLV